MFQDSPDRFVVEKPEFMQLSAGPAQALKQCVAALRRGSRAVVLTSPLATERRSIVNEVGRLLGRANEGVTRIEGALAGCELEAMLTAEGYEKTPEDEGFPSLAGAALAGIGLPPTQFSEQVRDDEQGVNATSLPASIAPRRISRGWKAVAKRRLVMIDNVEMLNAKVLGRLGQYDRHRDGSSVQLLLSGMPQAISRLCEPDSSELWQGVGLAVSLRAGDRMKPANDVNLDSLRADIARTEAKLASQKRMLAIFTDHPHARNGRPMAHPGE